MKKDTILVLPNTLISSSRVPGRNVLDRETERRVEAAVDLYGQGKARFILMEGGLGVTVSQGDWLLRKRIPTQAAWVPLGTRPVISDLMKVYAQHLGVLEGSIFVQPSSCDCVSEAIFAYGMFLRDEAFGWKDNTVVTNAYAVPRLIEIYAHVLGPSFTTEVVGIPAEGIDDPQNHAVVEEKERSSLAAFRRDFGDITPGDLERLVRRLYERHPYYKDIPERYRVHF